MTNLLRATSEIGGRAAWSVVVFLTGVFAGWVWQFRANVWGGEQ